MVLILYFRDGVYYGNVNKERTAMTSPTTKHGNEYKQ